MNVSNILYNLLSISAAETQKGRPHSISHHYLIKLLVERSLRDVSLISWYEFVEIRRFRVENVGSVEPLPSQEREKFENLEKPGSPIEPSFSRISPEKNVPVIEEPLQEKSTVGVPS